MQEKRFHRRWESIEGKTKFCPAAYYGQDIVFFIDKHEKFHIRK